MRKILITICLWATALGAGAQALESSLWAEHKFSKKLSVEMGSNLLWADDSYHFERISLGAGIGYKFNKHLKVAAGYKFMRHYTPETTTEDIKMKLNGIDYDSKKVKTTDSYWDSRHRAYASVTGDIDLGRFNVSLREMYQYTHRGEASANRTTRTYEEFDDVYDGVPVWYDDFEETTTTKTFKSKDKHTLRSRLKVDYNIARCPVDPYVSFELFNNLAIAKKRFMAGADWKISKKHTLGISYMYQSITGNDDDDDLDESLISLNYKINF